LGIATFFQATLAGRVVYVGPYPAFQRTFGLGAQAEATETSSTILAVPKKQRGGKQSLKMSRIVLRPELERMGHKCGDEEEAEAHLPVFLMHLATQPCSVDGLKSV
jgi:hypothetical protein